MNFLGGLKEKLSQGKVQLGITHLFPHLSFLFFSIHVLHWLSCETDFPKWEKTWPPKYLSAVNWLPCSDVQKSQERNSFACFSADECSEPKGVMIEISESWLSLLELHRCIMGCQQSQMKSSYKHRKKEWLLDWQNRSLHSIDSLLQDVFN